MLSKIFRYVTLVVLMSFGALQAEAAEAVKIQSLTVGNEDAPVTITEFSSYTCPHCANFHGEQRQWLIDTFVKTGRAKLVLHDTPLDGLAMGAAMLVHSMPKDTAYAFSETLFKQQQNWAHAKDPRAALITLAGLAGYSKDKVESVFADKALFKALMDKRTYALDVLKIEGTPTLMIGGEKLSAFASQKELTSAVEAAEKAAKSGK